MSEIKVNKIQPAAGDRIVVAAPIQGADAPSDCPDCLATLRQVGGGGSVGVSQAYVDEKDDATLLAAKRYSDEQNELQNNELTLDINAAKTEAINSANAHSDANDSDTLLSANAYTDSKFSGVTQLGAIGAGDFLTPKLGFTGGSFLVKTGSTGKVIINSQVTMRGSGTYHWGNSAHTWSIKGTVLDIVGIRIMELEGRCSQGTASTMQTYTGEPDTIYTVNYKWAGSSFDYTDFENGTYTYFGV